MNAAPVIPPAPPKKPSHSPTETLVEGDPSNCESAATKEDDQQQTAPVLSTFRRYFLLLIFCLAQFLDNFNNSALFPAIPTLVNALNLTGSEQTWVISAFQLTYASFLLISGRISDVYGPKKAFIIGVGLLGALSIGIGFVRDAILFLVLRAFCGIAAALTIPSALTLLVSVFPEPDEQSRAIGIFGGCGAIGNVLGLVVGALIVEFASWPWVFWFVACIAIPVAIGCIFVIPHTEGNEYKNFSQREKLRSLDLIGIGILTAAIVLFIFAVTSGSIDGWATASVLAPLIISIAMVGVFFYWETLIPASKAAVPPRTWFLPNFSVLFGVALLPYLWWSACFTIFTTLWQDVFHWSIVSGAIHIIPFGLSAFIVSFGGSLSRVINSKLLILFGLFNMVIGTVLLAFTGSPADYWRHDFPAFVIGSAGCMLAFSHTNIAIFRTSPPSMAGTVGAMFNGALQLGSAVGLAAISSITSSVQEKKDGPGEGTDPEDPDFAGRQAAFWFLLAIICVELLSVAFLYRTRGQGWRGEKDQFNVHLLEAGKNAPARGGDQPEDAKQDTQDDLKNLEKGEKAFIPGESNKLDDGGKGDTVEVEEVPRRDSVDPGIIEEGDSLPSNPDGVVDPQHRQNDS